MTISSTVPASGAIIATGATITFTNVIGETVISITLNRSGTGDSNEVIWTSISGYDTPYTGSRVLDGADETFTFRRNAGWNTSPFQIDVETSTAVEQLTYILLAEGEYPPDMQPFNDPLEGGSVGGVTIDGTTNQDAVLLTERADHVNIPTAGQAEIWLKDGTGQELKYTDDFGADYNIARISGTITDGGVLTASGDDSGDTTVEANVRVVGGGRLVLDGTSPEIRLSEKAADAGVIAGEGQYWVRNDTPNRPIFTDDAGVDHDLTAGTGGGSSVEVVDDVTTLTLGVTKLTWKGAGVSLSEPVQDEIEIEIDGAAVPAANLSPIIETGTGTPNNDANVPASSPIILRDNAASLTPLSIERTGSEAGEDDPAFKITTPFTGQAIHLEESTSGTTTKINVSGITGNGDGINLNGGTNAGAGTPGSTFVKAVDTTLDATKGGPLLLWGGRGFGAGSEGGDIDISAGLGNGANDGDISIGNTTGQTAFVGGFTASAGVILDDADNVSGLNSVITSLFSADEIRVLDQASPGPTGSNGRVKIWSDSGESPPRIHWKDSANVDHTIVANNYGATTDPVVGDDNLDGYAVGSTWINTTSDEAFTCLDASTGAAVWKSVTDAASGVGDVTAAAVIGANTLVVGDNGGDKSVRENTNFTVFSTGILGGTDSSITVDAVTANLQLNTGRDVQFVEQTTDNWRGGSPTTAHLWVKDDTPNTLYFKDDEGTNHNLLAVGSADVTGPASAVDDNIATFDATTGKLIQDSGIAIGAIAAAQTKADDALPRDGSQAMTGNITMTGAGTVDGRDVSADGTVVDANAVYVAALGALDDGGASFGAGVYALGDTAGANAVTEEFTVDDPNPNNVTIIKIHNTGKYGTGSSEIMAGLEIGDWITLHPANSVSVSGEPSAALFRVDSAVSTPAAGNNQYTVVHISSNGTAFDTTTNYSIGVIRTTATFLRLTGGILTGDLDVESGSALTTVAATGISFGGDKATGGYAVSPGAPTTAAVGKILTVSSGNAGPGGNHDGGNLILYAGAEDGTGTAGKIEIGLSANQTSQVEVGATSVPTHVLDTLEVDGAVTFNTKFNVENAVNPWVHSTLENQTPDSGKIYASLQTGQINSLTIKNSPVAGDMVLIEDSAAGYGKKKAAWPSIAAELNDLEATATNAADNQVFVGTAADTGTYITLPTTGAVAFNGTAFAQAALADLSDVTTPTGTGEPVLATSPTIVTPTIASMTNAQHDHADAAGGGTIAYASITGTPTVPTHTKSITVPDPASGEIWDMWTPPEAITITGISYHCRGTTPSVPFNVAHGTNPTSLADIDSTGWTATNTTSIIVDTTFAGGDLTVAANETIAVDITGAVTGTNPVLHVDVRYTVD